ncbi:hypothetical protein B0H63DRAFT_526053 [Podospora didyma]|uniref:Uncharacterized protein n=1 Tax=Podospora didyma TaxID=330526 RepID=A0AAE0N8K0_9PEZI|nr:hypothetical protein B0H63DRAFT_526053 [Podospora didyma]
MTSSPLSELPVDILLMLPDYLHSFWRPPQPRGIMPHPQEPYEHNLPGNKVLQLVADYPDRAFFEGHPLFTILASARSATNWVLQKRDAPGGAANEKEIKALNEALKNGMTAPGGLYDFCLEHGSGATLPEMWRLLRARETFIRPLAFELDSAVRSQRTPEYRSLGSTILSLWKRSTIDPPPRPKEKAVVVVTVAEEKRSDLVFFIFGEISGTSYLKHILDDQEPPPPHGTATGAAGGLLLGRDTRSKYFDHWVPWKAKDISNYLKRDKRNEWRKVNDNGDCFDFPFSDCYVWEMMYWSWTALSRAGIGSASDGSSMENDSRSSRSNRRRVGRYRYDDDQVRDLERLVWLITRFRFELEALLAAEEDKSEAAEVRQSFHEEGMNPFRSVISSDCPAMKPRLERIAVQTVACSQERDLSWLGFLELDAEKFEAPWDSLVLWAPCSLY